MGHEPYPISADPSPPSDDDIDALIMDNPPEGIRRWLVSNKATRILATLKRRARDAGYRFDPDDAFAEARKKAWRGIAKYRRSKGTFTKYFSRIVRNTVSDMLKKRREEPLNGEAYADQRPSSEAPESEDSRTQREHRVQRLHVLIGRLEGVQREVMYRLARNQTPAEIALQLQKTIGHVYNARFEAIKKLRRWVEQDSPDASTGEIP